MNPSPTRVILVDDHTLIIEGLRKILDRNREIVVVGEARSAEELLDLLRRQEAEIVILDIDLPGRSGLDVLPDVTVARPGVKVLMLSMYAEESFALRALQAGAMGYISKRAVTEDLVTAIQTIAGGETYVSSSMTRSLVDQMRQGGGAGPLPALSGREFEVLRLIASGRSVGEIAQQISLSVHTVTTYRARLLKKLGLKTNADLVRYALDNDLIR